MGYYGMIKDDFVIWMLRCSTVRSIVMKNNLMRCNVIYSIVQSSGM